MFLCFLPRVSRYYHNKQVFIINIMVNNKGAYHFDIGGAPGTHKYDLEVCFSWLPVTGTSIPFGMFKYVHGSRLDEMIPAL